MKRALLIGINEYRGMSLSGCLNDVEEMEKVLSKNEDDSKNFECKKIIAPFGEKEFITRPFLRQNINELFNNKAEDTLLYFSGHGFEDNLGAYLVTQDYQSNDVGIPMYEILTIANNSLLKQIVDKVVIIFDCCHSGSIGKALALGKNTALLAEGLTILSASRSYQPAKEVIGKGGIFTSLLIEALKGSAADLLGDITLSSAYRFVEQLLGAWDQRPLFKTHVSETMVLRKCKPKIDLKMLRRIKEHFPKPEYEYKLDPSYESDKHHAPPDKKEKNEKNEKIFEDFRKYASLNLVVPVGEQYLYWAAVRSKSCKLTLLGRYYWHRVDKGI